MAENDTEIEWTEVNSSNLARYRYDPDTRVLEIQFNHNGDTYSYDDVPQDVVDGFRYAGSAGQYFQNNIKNRYRFYKG